MGEIKPEVTVDRLHRYVLRTGDKNDLFYVHLPSKEWGNVRRKRQDSVVSSRGRASAGTGTADGFIAF